MAILKKVGVATLGATIFTIAYTINVQKIESESPECIPILSSINEPLTYAATRIAHASYLANDGILALLLMDDAFEDAGFAYQEISQIMLIVVSCFEEDPELYCHLVIMKDTRQAFIYISNQMFEIANFLRNDFDIRQPANSFGVIVARVKSAETRLNKTQKQLRSLNFSKCGK